VIEYSTHLGGYHHLVIYSNENWLKSDTRIGFFMRAYDLNKINARYVPLGVWDASFHAMGHDKNFLSRRFSRIPCPKERKLTSDLSECLMALL
jgi:hypothetical protein